MLPANVTRLNRRTFSRIAAFALACAVALPAFAGRNEAIQAKKRGDALVKANQLDQAEGAYREAIRADVTYWEVHKDLGNLYFKQQKFAEAADQYAQATAKNSQYLLGYYNMAFANRKAGRFKEAVDAYEKYVALKQDDPDAFYGLAECYKQLGDLERAIKNYEKYADVEKRPSEAQWVTKARELAAQLKEIWQAQGGDKTKAAVEGNNAALAASMMSEGDDHMTNKAWVMAIHAYRDAARHDKENPEPLYKLALAFEQEGDLDQARDTLKQVLQLKADFPGATDALKRVEERIKSRSETVDPGIAVAKQKGDPRKLYNEALDLSAAGEYDKALAVINQALSGDMTKAEYHLARGDVLVGLERFPEAIDAYWLALRIDGNLASPYAGLGEAYAAVGDSSRAKQYTEYFLEQSGGEKWRVKRAKELLKGLKAGT